LFNDAFSISWKGNLSSQETDFSTQFRIVPDKKLKNNGLLMASLLLYGWKDNNHENNFRRRRLMDQKDLKKILAGLSVTTLVAGATLLGIGYPEPAQAA
jgi:radical SAM modification target selenobiotic family peptide